MQLLKQKSEYAFSLSSQVEAKNKELQHQEDLLQQEKAKTFHTSKELQEVASRKKVRGCSSMVGIDLECAYTSFVEMSADHAHQSMFE